MEGVLYVLTFFILRLGVPALILLAVGEVVQRHSKHSVAGGD